VTLAFVTDYDVWRQDEDDVSVDMVVKNLGRNVRTSQIIIRRMIRSIPESRDCACGNTLETAIITGREAIPPETLERVGLLVDRYLE
jgi:5'-methylthioadenosine phosphorylase